MRVLGAGPDPRNDRAASAILHDEANARVIGFHLSAGQRIAPHRSESTVIVQVVSGTGVFRGEGTEATLAAGQLAVFEPGELHAIDAGAAPLRFVAVVAPGPAV